MPDYYAIHGRENEVELLLQAWREAAAGNTRLVIVSGDPGTGKTRLVQELYHRLRDEVDGGKEYWPENFGYERQTSHLSIRLKDFENVPPEMPYFWFGLKCKSPIEGSPGSFEAFINARGQLWQHFVQPAILRNRKKKMPWSKIWDSGANALGLAAVYFPEPTLVMLALGAKAYTSAIKLGEHYDKQRSERTQQAAEQRADQPDLGKLIENLLREANQEDAKSRGIARVPWIITIDDVQWLDADSRALLRDLLSDAVEQGRKLLVVATARCNMPEGDLPGIKAQLDKVRGDDKIYYDIELSDHQADKNSLSEEAAKEILIDHLSVKKDDGPGVDPPGETVARLLKRAGRNPQYIIHYARYVRDLGLINKETFELTATDKQLSDIPEEIERLIDDRLKLLGEGSLKHTAVIGGSLQGEIFCAGYIEQLVKDRPGENDVAQALDELVKVHHLIEDVEDILPPERLCKYQHTLTFERAHKILDSQRGFRDRCAIALGEILRKKLDDGSLDGWPEPERIAAWRTLCKYANERKLPGDVKEREDWEKTEFKAGELALDAMHKVGDNIDAEGIADMLWQDIRAKPPWIDEHPRAVTGLLLKMIDIYVIRGKYNIAIDCYHQLLEICQKLKNIYGAALTMNGMGTVYGERGDYDKALDCFRQSLDVLRQQKNEYVTANTLGNMGAVYQLRGKYDKALELYEQSLDVKQRLGDEHGEAVTLGNMGNVYRILGNYDDALVLCQKSLDAKQRLGDVHGAAGTLVNIALLQRSQGKLEEAQENARQALDIYTRLGAKPDAAKAEKLVQLLEEEIADRD